MPGIADKDLSPFDAIYRAVCREQSAITDEIELWDLSERFGYDRWRNTPIHEAGHAVMAKHFRVSLYGAALYGRDDPEQSVAEGAVHVGKPVRQWHRTYEERVSNATKSPLSDTNCITVALVLIYQAGLLAEVLAADRRPGPNELVFIKGSPDHRLAMYYAGPHDPIRMLLACQRVALDILERRWDALLFVAAALKARRFVSGLEITGLTQQAATIN